MGWLAGGLCAVLVLSLGASLAGAEDSDRLRYYLDLRFGESNPLTRTHDVGGVSLGANLSRYLGAELSMDYYELNLELPGQPKIGELSVFAIAPQVRLRYPLLDDRLVPYFLAGAGVAVAQLNDPTVPTSLSNGSFTDAQPMGVMGVGIEYFLADNIAFGLEGKGVVAGSQGFDADGTAGDVGLSAAMAVGSFRLFYPELHPGQAAESARRATVRFYLDPRVGGALFVHDEPFSGVEARPELSMLGTGFTEDFGASVGASFSSWAAVELSLDVYEAELSLPGVGRLGEYSLFPILLQPRLRWPLLDGRLETYALGGVGVEFAEFNDGTQAARDRGIEGNDSALVGTLGAGLEYYPLPNVAIGLESRYVFSRGHTLRIGDGPELDGNLDTLVLSLGLRMFLFDL